MDFFKKQSRYVSYFIYWCTYLLFILNTGKRPELHDLVKLLDPIRTKWDVIGSQLGVDTKIIDYPNKSDVTKLNEVIQKWVETKPTPTTWNNIIEVVKGPVIQSKDVASTIKKYLEQILNEQRKAILKSM